MVQPSQPSQPSQVTQAAQDILDEQVILEIIRLLNKQDLDSFKSAISKLHHLLVSILPLIETYRKFPITSNNRLNKFIKLQDNFRHNLTSQLIKSHDWIYQQVNQIDDETILLYNRLLQGLLLIHPPSRTCFSNNQEMTKLIRFIELENPIVSFEITISFISTLLHVLLKNLDNFRVFETCNGCSIIIKKLNLSMANQQMLNFKIIEFLLFYLSDEDALEFSHKKSISDKSNYFRNDFPDIDNLVLSLNDLKTI